MDYLPGIFALLVAAAGWYYLLYSQAALRLHGVEDEARNRLRVHLRRVGGVVIMLLAAAFYAMFVMLRRERFVAAGVLVMVVMFLMGAVIVLGIVDLRLTRKLSGNTRDDRARERRG